MSCSSLKGPEVGYVDLLNHETSEYLKKEKIEGRSYQRTPIRPSAAGKCSRELYYEFMQYSGRAKYQVEPFKPEVHRLLNLGHTVESHIIRQFEQHLKMVQVKYKQQVLSFYRIEAEKDQALSQWLEGSMDLCVWSEQWKCVIDIKSKKDKFSSYRSSKWDEDTEKLARMASTYQLSDSAFWVENLDAFLDELGDPFFAANFLQLNLYLNSDFLKNRGVDHGAIIQYSKNDSRLREIRFAPSQTLFDRVRAKFEGVVAAVDTDNPELAPRDYTLGSMKCAFCDFKGECWKEDTLKAWFRTFSKKQWPTDTSRLGAMGDTLETMFQDYATTESAVTAKRQLEDRIIKLCVDNELTKLRLASGNVYEVVHRKSPRPHFELKRSKT